VVATSDVPLLSVHDLGVRYRSGRGEPVAAVRGISFDVRPGELVALVGESGSGKSTTAQAVLGLLPAGAELSGDISFDGRSVTGLSSREWRALRGRRIAYVPQDPTSSLNPTRRIGRQVAEAITVHERGIKRQQLNDRVISLLDRVGLPDPQLRARQYPHELSGGMRQRVLIAAALAGGPDLIIADEATSALDVTVQQQILDHLGELQAELGVAILLITHDLGVAGDRADRIVVLSDGEVAESGTADDVLLRPRSDYTRRLVAAVPTVDHGRLHWTPPGESVTLVGPELPVREPILVATGLHKSFRAGRSGRQTRAVDGVDLTVARGRTLGIVGESGSGKSTLARLLTRLVAPDSGSIRLDGEEISQLAGEELRLLRRRIQIVYQNPFASVDPRFTVGRTLVEPLRAFGIGTADQRQERAAELLEQVGLPVDFLHRLPAELSGGQLQRVAIARALASEPELIVLDEAVSALDVSVQAQILRLLARLQAQLDVTFVFISHDLAVIRQVSDDVLVMDQGRVVESGTADAVFDHPSATQTMALLRAVPGRGRQVRPPTDLDVEIELPELSREPVGELA